MFFCWKLHESYTFLLCKETLPIELVQELSRQVAPFAHGRFAQSLAPFYGVLIANLPKLNDGSIFFLQTNSFLAAWILMFSANLGPNHAADSYKTKHISQETAEAYLGRCLVGNMMFGCYWYKCDWWTFVISRCPCVLESKLPIVSM